MKLALVPAIAAVVALSMTPALAKSKKHYRHHGYYAQQYPGWGYGYGWTSRNVSDPSFGNRAGINSARSSGRCVSDLGYGRYEYCGW